MQLLGTNRTSTSRDDFARHTLKAKKKQSRTQEFGGAMHKRAPKTPRLDVRRHHDEVPPHGKVSSHHAAVLDDVAFPLLE